jgi:tetratricopeptide (TPR) repeat protein
MSLPNDSIDAGNAGSVSTTSASDLLATAVRLHLAGRLGEAEAIYKMVLAQPSPHAGANYCLGLLCQNQGRLAEAAESYRRAIAIRADDADSTVNLATTLLALGDIDGAVALYRRAIAIRPNFALAYANLGKALQDRREYADAIAAYRHAIALEPDYGLAFVNLGGALLEQEMFADSVAISEQAVRLRPDVAMAHVNLGAAMFRLGRFEDALIACRHAIALQPGDAMTCATVGGVMLELGAFQESATACRRAIALDPAIAIAHFNLAHACKGLNRIGEAEAACREAVALDGDRPEYHFLLAHILLVQGDFGPGWNEYEWRWRMPGFEWLREFQAETEQPMWTGEDLAGKTILLLTEQGLGDMIMFVRYAPLLAARGALVIVAAPQSLQRVLASIAPAAVVPIGQRPLPRFDVYCPLLSVPRLFGLRCPPASASGPYLRADPALRQVWRARLGTGAPRVGVVWGGNPVTKYDRLRSPRLAAMMPLFDVPGIVFVALQAGPARDDLTATPLPSHVIDLGAELDDLATTAAVMAELDLVISSCTAPLHLAGALGVPTWALLPFAPYFPWLLEGEESAWYPSMRLYRRDGPEPDWSETIARVARDLGTMRRSVPSIVPAAAESLAMARSAI